MNLNVHEEGLAGLSSTVGYIKQLLFTLGLNNKPVTEIKINFLVCVQIRHCSNKLC